MDVYVIDPENLTDQNLSKVFDVLFAGTEAQNEQCCGEPDNCTYGQDGAYVEPAQDSRVEADLKTVRGFLQNLVITVPLVDEVVQYLFEADQALEDAQIHIADQAEKEHLEALQAEEDEVVDAFRIETLIALGASTVEPWSNLEKHGQENWRKRFHAAAEFIANID